MWRGRTFVETFCLGLWMNHQTLSRILYGISLKLTLLDPIWRTHLGLCPPPPLPLHCQLPCSPWLQASQPQILTVNLYQILTLAGPLGRWQSIPFSMVVKTSEMKPLEIQLRCHHCISSVHPVSLVISYGHRISLSLSLCGWYREGTQ